jgi:hypothetical protein
VLRYENFVLIISKTCDSGSGHCAHDGIEANRAARVSKRIFAFLAAALDGSCLIFEYPLANARGSVSSRLLASISNSFGRDIKGAALGWFKCIIRQVF